jgi:hypothetical protein
MRAVRIADTLSSHTREGTALVPGVVARGVRGHVVVQRVSHQLRRQRLQPRHSRRACQVGPERHTQPRYK